MCSVCSYLLNEMHSCILHAVCAQQLSGQSKLYSIQFVALCTGLSHVPSPVRCKPKLPPPLTASPPQTPPLNPRTNPQSHSLNPCSTLFTWLRYNLFMPFAMQCRSAPRCSSCFEAAFSGVGSSPQNGRSSTRRPATLQCRRIFKLLSSGCFSDELEAGMENAQNKCQP